MARKIPIRDPDALIKPRSAFKDYLEGRVTKGKELMNKQIGPADLNQFDKDCGRWHDLNSEYLKQAFNNEDSQYKNDYDRAGMMDIAYKAALRIQSNPVAKAKERLQHKIENLESLVERIDLLKSEIEQPQGHIMMIFIFDGYGYG